MGYHVIDPAELDQYDDRDADVRSISAAAGLEVVGMREYAVEPGEMIPLSYHYHDEQEEAFYVLAGELSVETPDRTYRLGEGRVFVAEPGSPHRAFNADDAAATLRVLAVGAPSISDAHSYEP